MEDLSSLADSSHIASSSLLKKFQIAFFSLNWNPEEMGHSISENFFGVRVGRWIAMKEDLEAA